MQGLNLTKPVYGWLLGAGTQYAPGDLIGRELGDAQFEVVRQDGLWTLLRLLDVTEKVQRDLLSGYFV